MMVPVVGRCPFCGNTIEISVDEKEFEAWENGELVQNAFPSLTPTQRELFITGTCFDCQSNIFDEDDNDDNEDDEGFLTRWQSMFF